MADYNKEHAASIEFVQDAVVEAYDKMMTWVTTHADQLDYVQRIIAKLREAYRGGSWTSAMEYANAINDCVIDMAAALRSAGAQVGEKDLSEFAQMIYEVSALGYEICILGDSGTHYSVQEWQEYVAQHGTTPEAHAVPAVITPYQSFAIGLPTENTGGNYSYITKQWGNTTDNVYGVSNQQAGSFINVLQNSLMFASLDNTWRMLLWYNPEILPHTDYDPNDPSKDYGSYGCVRFATKAEMEASGQHLSLDKQVYVVTNDETDNTTNQCYYWEGSRYVRRFQVPRVANNITGSPAAQQAWQYKAHENDARQWALPTTNHLLMMYVYYNEINACLAAINRGTLPTGNTWTCQQGTANYAYYVTIPSANVSNVNKNGASAIVPVAAL